MAAGCTGGAVAPRSYRAIGFLTGTFGLAVACRNAVDALSASGRRVERVVVQHRHAGGGEADAPASPSGHGDVNLFVMNPPDIAAYAGAWRDSVDGRAPCACVPFWELPLVPREWEGILAAMDAILAPTRFIQEACARVVPAERVVHFPQAVFVPAASPVRDAWGLRPGATVFLVSFDVGSDIERKNPRAAVEAFRRAFPGGENVQLIIKAKPWRNAAALAAQVRKLTEEVAGDSRIRVIDRELEYRELMALYASCDVLVALHRSEGLGLHLMEAMSLGKAVVATGWSGNMDFMSPRNSVPLRYTLVPVRSAHQAYAREASREGQQWAEPDLEDAARALRLLHLEPDRRRALGATAAADMEEARHRFLSGAVFGELEATLAGVSPDPSRLSTALRRATALARWRSLLGAPAAVARRLAASLRG
jgi:glycosyltransferase involved in cell wall biosynthesis